MRMRMLDVCRMPGQHALLFFSPDAQEAMALCVLKRRAGGASGPNHVIAPAAC